MSKKENIEINHDLLEGITRRIMRMDAEALRLFHSLIDNSVSAMQKACSWRTDEISLYKQCRLFAKNRLVELEQRVQGAETADQAAA